MNEKFKKHWQTLSASEKQELAANAKTSTAYLSQVANGHRNAGFSLIKKLIKQNGIGISMFTEAA